MPDYDDATTSADELAEQVRALAYATRDFGERTGDTNWVLGSMMQANRRLLQVYSQVAGAHIAAEGLAHTDDGNAAAGREHAHAAAAALRRAGWLVEQVDRELDTALQASGRIAWHNSPAVQASAGLEQEVDGPTVDPDTHGLGA
ncbi:MAG: hypothetical protein ACTMIR_11605 [Cellulomonadaceae bacterium]